MKAKIAAIAVVALLTLSVVAVGALSVGQARDGAAAVGESRAGADGGDSAAVSAFKFVCPFH